MRTFAKRLFPALALFTAMAASGARAADTDLFSGIQASGVPPNVLVVLDNSGAWNSNVSFNCPSSVGLTLPAGNVNTAGGFEQCALYSVMNNIATNTALLGAFNLGMMLFSTGSGNGGTFFFPATLAPSALPLMDKTGIASFQSQIAQLKVGGSGSNTANGSAVGATMQEVWAFYSAKTGFSGTRYASSPIANACQKNFLIYIVNATNTGKPQDNTDNAVFQTLACPAGSAGPTNGASCAGATTAQQTQISLNPTYAKYQGSWADEWARFAYQTDISGTFTNQQNIVTYTIAVTDGSNPDYVQLLRSMASNGGGKFFTVNLGDMDALLQASEQRVRFGEPAGERERAGHLPEPDLHGHVPPRSAGQPALGGQPEAVPVRYRPELGQRGTVHGRRDRRARAQLRGHGFHFRQRDQFLDEQEHQRSAGFHRRVLGEQGTRR